MEAIYKVWNVENPETVYYFNDFSEVENKVNEIQSTGAFASWDFVADSEEPTDIDPVNPYTLTPAGYCLDVYLNNERDIYDRCTVPAIERVTRAIRSGEYVSDNAGQLAKDIQEITSAINAAARMVKRYDGLTPTSEDIQQVTRNYAAYIVDCAKHELETAKAI